MRNPFRRSVEAAPSLRERAASLRDSLTGSVRKPEATPAAVPEAEGGSTLEDFAGLDFPAYTLDVPLKTPTEWADRFNSSAMAMHIADRTLRMTKPELIAFIRKAGETDAATPEIMFRNLDTSQETLEGWGNLLGTARARYIVAAAAASLEIPQTVEAGETEPEIEPETPSFAEQVTRAGHAGDVLAASGIDHRDGTVSYADARGTVVRRPMSHWVAFNAQQMHGRVKGEICRREVIEANHLPMAERIAWDAKIRRELCSDAVFALAFRPERAFQSEQDFRSGAEREKGDADLRALASTWKAAIALYQQRINEEETTCEAAGEDGWPGRAPDGSGPEWEAWVAAKEAWRDRTGVAAAEQATSEAGNALHQIELQIAALPAASLAGLKLKARVGQRSDDIGVDWPDNLGAGLAQDILAFAETASVGRPDLTNPDALGVAILDGWAEWGATPCDPDGSAESVKTWERVDAQRDRLLYAAMALPATPENIVAKALACAWMEWVCVERPGQPREDYGPADQLAYDLHATIIKGRPSAGASRPVTSHSYLADGIDFASASMKELLTIRDIAECIGDVAAAYAWGGRCRHRMNAYGAPEYNAAGRMVTSLSDALTAVETAAEREARQRTPDYDWERNIRLFMLSPTVIDNDDPDEIEAFGREILAHAEALRSQG